MEFRLFHSVILKGKSQILSHRKADELGVLILKDCTYLLRQFKEYLFTRIYF